MAIDRDSLLLRMQGAARTGTVDLRDFDRGVVETMGAFVAKDEGGKTKYFLKIEGVDAPPGSPGVAVIFDSPEDVFSKYQLPFVLVKRDDISPAMERWHPGMLQYRAPGAGALVARPYAEGNSFFDRVEELQQAVPFDFAYSVSIFARHRGAPGNKNAVSSILKYVLRVYQPYGSVFVKDSIGDTRSYEMFMEGVSTLDQISGVTERVVGFAVNLRLEGELDLNDPYVKRTVLRRLTVGSNRL